MKDKTTVLLLLLGLTSISAVKLQSQLSSTSLAQSGVMVDEQLGTEILSESFLEADAIQEAEIISEGDKRPRMHS